MSELHRRILECYERLGVQEIDGDDYVDNLPEYLPNLKHALKFPIHAALKKKISFYNPYWTKYLKRITIFQNTSLWKRIFHGLVNYLLNKILTFTQDLSNRNLAKTTIRYWSVTWFVILEIIYNNCIAK